MFLGNDSVAHRQRYRFAEITSRGTEAGGIGTIMARVGGSKQLTRARFCALLQKAFEESGVVQARLAEAMGRDPTTISNDLRPDKGEKPPKPKIRKRYEEHLGLRPGYLDGAVDEDWQDYARNRRRVAMSLIDHGPAPLPTPANPQGTARVIREQLAIYEAIKRDVPPAIVRGWVDLLEGELASRGLAVAASAIEAVELASEIASAPSPGRVSGGKPQTARGRRAG